MSVLNKMIRICFVKEVRFEPSLIEVEGVRDVDMWKGRDKSWSLPGLFQKHQGGQEH